MDKRKIVLVLGVLLLMITVNFIGVNREILFDQFNRNGGTVMELNVTNEVNIDKLKEIIHENANLKTESMRIENTNGLLIVRFELVELEVINAIEKAFSEAFGDTVQISAYERVGKSTKSIGLYIIYLAILGSLLLSISLIIVNAVSISERLKEEKP